MTATPSPERPLLDPEGVAHLRSLAEPGSDLLEEVLQLFEDSTEQDLVAVETAIAARDPDGVERAAHRMCSSAAAAGAEALRRLARNHCTAARRGVVPTRAQGLELRTLRDRSLDALEDALAGA